MTSARFWVECRQSTHKKLGWMLDCLREIARSIPGLRRGINRLRGRRIHDPEIKLDDIRLGTEYGGWSVDLHRLDSSSIVYLIGVGEDISFDLALIEAVGCTVNAFDPTPIAVNWVAKQSLPATFVFHALGIAGQDGEVDFHLPPTVGSEHSYSMTADPRAPQFGTVKCQVRTLSSLMAQLGHTQIDLLKLDIEGFEYQVIENIIEAKIRPKCLLVEFHHLAYGIAPHETVRAVERLRRYGFKLYYVSDVGAEYGFIDGNTFASPR